MAVNFAAKRIWRGHTFVTVAPANPVAGFRRDATAVAMKILLFPFDDYYAFAKDAVGWGKVVTKGAHQYLSRITPMPLEQLFDGRQSGEPFLENLGSGPMLYCTEVSSVTPKVWGDVSKDPSYQIAECELKFETLAYDIADDSALPTDSTYTLPTEGQWTRFVDVTGSGESQVVQLPRGNFKYVSDQQPHPYPGGFVVSKQAVKVTWHDVPTKAIASKEIPGNSGFSGTAYLDNARGLVNADTWNGHAPGTLLFETWTYEPHRDVFGNRTWVVTLNLSKNVKKWNYVPRVTNGGTMSWVLITSDGTNVADSDTGANDGKRLYDSRNFSQLMLAPDP